MFDNRLECVSVAPLETPVVPPVYCRKATSAGFTSTALSVWPPPFARTALKDTWPWQRPGRDQLFHLAHDDIDDQALEPEKVAHGGDDGVLQIRACRHLLDRMGEVFENENRLGAGILQLVFQLGAAYTAD